MRTDCEVQKTLNIQHANNPQPGDYWQELFIPIRLVIRVDSGIVEYLDSQIHVKTVDADHWTWDINKPSCLCMVAEFSEFLQYSSKSMKDEYWCNVVPKAGGHKWAVDAYSHQ